MRAGGVDKGFGRDTINADLQPDSVLGEGAALSAEAEKVDDGLRGLLDVVGLSILSEDSANFEWGEASGVDFVDDHGGV